MKDTNLYITEDQQTPSRINIKKSTNRHILVKTVKVKDKKKLLKAAKRNDLSLTRDPRKVVAYSAERVETRRQWNNILKLLKEKDCHKKSYIQQTCLSKMKEIKTFQINKN